MKNFGLTPVLRMAVAIAAGATAGYGLLHLHKATPAKKPPSVQEIKFQEPDDGLSHLLGRDFAPYWEEARTADASFQEICDGVLLFVDPSCSACDRIFPTALQVREQFPVVLAVDRLPSAELDSYLAYFGAGDLPVMYDTVKLRRVLPVDYWPTAIVVRKGSVVWAGNGSASIDKILTEVRHDSGGFHELTHR